MVTYLLRVLDFLHKAGMFFDFDTWDTECLGLSADGIDEVIEWYRGWRDLALNFCFISVP